VIASAHQPHFLPWLGYINKLANSDVFIWLNTVQYRKNYFQNRTRIMGRDGVERWLTVPVHARHDSTIEQVTIADPAWKQRVFAVVQQAYGTAPHFAEYWPPLRDAIESAADTLDDANYRPFCVLLRLLDLTGVQVVRASDLAVQAADPTERLVLLCQQVGADAYIAGKGGRDYMRMELFEQAGIDVLWQQFDVERTLYPRAGGEPAGALSVIDALFHAGAQETRDLVRQAWLAPR
jgi:hypothetical protein